ncbi:MAG: DUF547 domain-containing protein [Alphaproteobacteria bacterium]|nr:DUF547 domain-containing protein [Alphaproteobacteria bacterium]
MVVPGLILALTGCAQQIAAPPAPAQDPWPTWDEALGAVVTPSGRVDYDALRARRAALDGVLGALAVDPGPSSDDALLARRINAYNAFVLAGVLERAPIDSVHDVAIGIWRVPAGTGFFKGLEFRLDGDRVDLHTLEHTLIRARFRDPRVHAALNCASAGCPPLKAGIYHPETLDAELDAAFTRFVKTRCRLDGDTLALSEVFDWFEDDFLAWGGAQTVCHYAARYEPDWTGIAEAGCPHRFEPWDWSLNAAVVPPPLATAPAPWGDSDGGCPPGMVRLPAGTWTTGMKQPFPYGVVDTTQMAVVEAPERFCDGAIGEAEGATACWVRTDLYDPVVPLHEVTVPDACIEPLPFPGAGPYPPDGMSTWDAAQFDAMLSSGRFGPRRMCTFTEYELAVAGPTQDLRFLYGDAADPGRCPASEDEGIGARPACANPETGVGEYGAVISQWVVADPQFVANACPDPPGCAAAGGRALVDEAGQPAIRYLVAGGTRRVQTRQAPYTPHTWHDHGEAPGPQGCDDWGWDDGPAVCADPDPRYLRCPDEPEGEGCAALALAEARWAALVEGCVGGTMTDCLNRGLSDVRGEQVEVCPDRPETLGPGQGR